jgi:hypothetical protein
MKVSAKGLAAVGLCALVSACASTSISNEVNELRQQNQQLQAQVAAINEQLKLDKNRGAAAPVHENQVVHIQSERGGGAAGSGKLCLSTAGIAPVSFAVYAVPCTSPGGPAADAQRWSAAPAP